MRKERLEKKRLERRVQVARMVERMKGIDSIAGQIALAKQELKNAPDYKTPAYTTLNEYINAVGTRRLISRDLKRRGL